MSADRPPPGSTPAGCGPAARHARLPPHAVAVAVSLVVAGCAGPPAGPRTALGRALALALAVLAGALIAGPVAIVIAELRRSARAALACARCSAAAHDADAVYCRRCGARLAVRAPGAGPGRATA